MTFRSVWLILPCTALPSAGCGTVHNLDPTKKVFIWGGGQDDQSTTTRVFGGVRDDWEGLSGMGWQDEYALLYSITIVPFFVADLPFSLLGDTVTLPYTAVYALFSQRPAPPKTTEEGKQPQPALAIASGSLAGDSVYSRTLSSRINLLLGY